MLLTHTGISVGIRVSCHEIKLQKKTTELYFGSFFVVKI